jgi:hypothetical protein
MRFRILGFNENEICSPADQAGLFLSLIARIFIGDYTDAQVERGFLRADDA